VTGAGPEKDPLARALALHRAGQRDEAEAAYRELLAEIPQRADGWHYLALLLSDAGRNDDAAAAVAEAIRHAPDAPMFRLTQGGIALRRNRADEAVAAFEAALARKPDLAEAASNLGLALAKANRPDAAEAAHRRAVAIDPGNAVAQYNLAQFLHRMNRIDGAIDAYRAALAIAPTHLASLVNLALAQRERGELAEAEATYLRATAAAPAAAEPWLGLGMVRKELARYEAAIDAFGEALRRAPTWPDAHVNLGLALLTVGRFTEGWPHYGSRWDAVPLRNYRRRFPVPLWEGDALGTRRLLVHAEQGLGDTIQFAHLLRELDADPAQIVFETPAALLPLLRPLARHATLVAKDATLPPFDLHAPLLDLLRHLDVTVDRIRPMTGLLEAEPARVERWRAALGNDRRPLVALCWRGGEENPENERRSMTTDALAPLLSLPDLRFVSLQKDAPAPHRSVIVPGPEFDPPGAAFLDSAAIMTVADFVVTVDTSLAHLAGALRRPAFLLLAYSAEWRWLTERRDSPWYPSLRLIRQKEAGDWRGPVEGVATALTRAIAELQKDGAIP